jgi:UPF0755 protein
MNNHFDEKNTKAAQNSAGGKSTQEHNKRKPVKHILPDSILRAIKYILVIFIASVIIFGGLLMHYSMSSISNQNTTVTVDIPTGASFFRVTKILDEAGLVKNKFLFNLLAMAKRATRVIRAGEYEFNLNLTPAAVINKLMRGDIKKYLVTIPEDFTIKDIAHRLDYFGLIDKDTFFELAKDKRFLDSLGIQADSIEGYLFPDTYLFNRSMSTRQIMTIMVSQFWKKVTPEMAEKAAAMGFTVHELVTFASLIGKESGYRDEKDLISAVFHNRLKKRMRLQSDPTAVYDLEDYQGKILLSHLKRNSPYNTYVIDGLPPGPIANPGIASIRAVLSPAPVKYLFFVSRNDGTHAFSENMRQHNEAIKELRRLQQEAKINNQGN